MIQRFLKMDGVKIVLTQSHLWHQSQKCCQGTRAQNREEERKEEEIVAN